MISLSGLNKNQQEAASTIDGPVLILAGAGSGKTRTITYRIAHMVANLEISPKSILGVSFTNKAAKEMRERVIGLLGKKKARGVTLSTFHSLGVKILKKEIDKLGYHLNFSIYDSSDQIGIIRDALRTYKAEKKFDSKDILSKIGFLKNQCISEDEFLHSPHFDPDSSYDLAIEYCYRFYQDKLTFFNAIDFDDILFLTVKLFKMFPELAAKYSTQFKYVMVDEYQDTNTLQFQIILALTSTHKNLCVVGDDDQSIYAFRGANVENILNFEQHYQGAKVIKLEQNYRSTSPIIKLAHEVIKVNKVRRDKTLWSAKESDERPILWMMGDTDHEAQVIVDEIVRYQGSGGYLGDIAVLYRSNTQVPPIEDELRLSNVPYEIVGGQKFYEKKEVKDLIAYMSVILNPNDEIALRRILNVPNRGIGTATLKKFLTISSEKNISLFEALKQYNHIDSGRQPYIKKFVDLIEDTSKTFSDVSLNEATGSLIDHINYWSFIEKQYHDSPKQAERRKNDVHTFIESAERFSKHNTGENALKFFVERLLLQDATDNKEKLDEDDTDIRKNEVTLMTLHSSKGLEFDIVYLIGVEEEMLPHKKTIQMGQDIDEERRLCYVGLTRAKEKLFMTYCKERKLYGKKTPRKKSRFLVSNEDFYLEQDRTNFGHLSEQEAHDYKKSFFADLLGQLDDKIDQ